MRWDFIKKFPKYALVLGLIVGSTVVFGLWWFMFRGRSAGSGRSDSAAVPVKDISKQIALVESKPERLLLVDNNLYDLDTGALIFKSWLKNGMPLKMSWEPASKTMLAQYERGFVRYRPDGTMQASFAQKYPLAISDDRQWILLVKDKDIWKADVDWKTLKLSNERKLTSIAQFHDSSFAANIVFGTDRLIVVRNLNTLLRVNLESGDVHPMKMNLDGIRKRRSPDGRSVVGIQNGQFYCYDVETDDAKTIPIGRGAINDWLWLGNDRCLAIAAMKTVILYDRKTHTLTELAALPSPCHKIGQPSPDGRFLFGLGRGNGVLLDMEKKKAIQLTGGGAGVSWVSNDTFAYSREVPDSYLRGMWLQTVGEGERRVSPEPYRVGRVRGLIAPVPAAGVVIFVTKRGISKMKPDGTGLASLIALPAPPSRVLGMDDPEAE